MRITTGHLCSGYDGLGLALDEAEPHDTLWHSEIDPAASRLLAREYPDVPNAGNLVELLLGDMWRLAPAVNMITAGFPCQPVSVAGRQLAQLDPRWLWPFIIEIFRQVRPFRIMIENVQNLVSIEGGQVWRTVLADLRDAGYAARWVVLGACAVGAPHHRHRVFLVADFAGPHAPEAARVAPRAVCGAPRAGGRFLLPTPKANDDKGAGTARIEAGKRAWGDLPTAIALLPTPAARDGGTRGTPSAEHVVRRVERGHALNLEDAIALLPTPRASDGERGRGNCGQVFGSGSETLAAAASPERWGKYAPAVALWESLTGRPAPEPTEVSPRGSRRLSADLPEWMMGLESGYVTKGATRAEALKLAGNGVVPQQAAAAYRLLTS